MHTFPTQNEKRSCETVKAEQQICINKLGNNFYGLKHTLRRDVNDATCFLASEPNKFSYKTNSP